MKKRRWAAFILVAYVITFGIVLFLYAQKDQPKEEKVTEKVTEKKPEKKPTSSVQKELRNGEKDSYSTRHPDVTPLEDGKDDETLEYEIKLLIDEMYMTDKREELRVKVRPGAYDEVLDRVNVMEDRERASELLSESAMSISYLYFQEDVREALDDDEAFSALDDKKMQELENVFKYAKKETPSVANYIESEWKELQEKYAREK